MLFYLIYNVFIVKIVKIKNSNKPWFHFSTKEALELLQRSNERARSLVAHLQVFFFAHLWFMPIWDVFAKVHFLIGIV